MDSLDQRLKTSKLHGLAALALAILTGGCFELKQTITLEQDGRLEFSLHYAIPEGHVDTFRQFHAQLRTWQDVDRDRGLNWLFNRQALDEYFPSDIFTINEYKIYQREGRRHVEVVGTASDGARALKSGRLGNFDLLPQPGKGVVLTLSPPRPERRQTVDEDERAALSEAARGFALTLVVKTPTPILTTNGRKTAANEVVWRFGPELFAHPEKLPEKLSVGF